MPHDTPDERPNAALGCCAIIVTITVCVAFVIWMVRR